MRLLDGNGDAIPGIPDQVTDADGNYIFANLPEGAYIVEFVAPDGRDFTTQDAPGSTEANDSDAGTNGRTAVINLGPGENNADVDAGIAPLGSISDLVFDDLNGDGIQDPGEPGLAGVTVRLLDGNGDPIPGIPDQVTNADGNYLFDNLPEGDYIVEFVAPDGRTFSPANAGDDDEDSDAGANGRTGVISLGAGEDNETVDAGIAPEPEAPAIGLSKNLTGGPTEGPDGTYTIQYTFVIENLGNVALSDVGIADDFAATFAGGTVESGPTPATTGCSVTAATNSASLAVGERCAATWTVVVSGLTPGETYNNTATATGTSPDGEDVSDVSDDGTDPDPDGDGNPDEDGENDPTPATIPPAAERAVLGDKVWNDANADGIQDPGEAPVAGVVVQVRRADGTGLIEVTTDANGMWSVELDAGDYDVAFVLPDGFAFAPRGSGDDTDVDSNVNLDGQTGTITLAAGEVNNSIDAGLVPLGSLGNRVFLDDDSDGIQDPGEPSVEGATVQLYEADASGAKGDLLETQETGPDGTYLFEDLLPGDYIIVVTPPAGLILGPQDAGADDDVDNDVSPVTGESGVIAVGVGENVDNVDAGVVPAPVVPPTAPFVPPAPPPLAIVTITNAPGPTPAPAAAPPAPPLALTGSSSNVLATLAIALMAVGGTLLIGVRRERDTE